MAVFDDRRPAPLTPSGRILRTGADLAAPAAAAFSFALLFAITLGIL
ncbi:MULTISPECIES: hypothetical protein [unclassified Rhizobium]|nr:hypothetical protein [Rhizobium sp. BG4]